MVGIIYLESQTFETVHVILQIKMQTYGIAVWQDSVLTSDNNIRIFGQHCSWSHLQFCFISHLSINHGNAHSLSHIIYYPPLSFSCSTLHLLFSFSFIQIIICSRVWEICYRLSSEPANKHWSNETGLGFCLVAWLVLLVSVFLVNIDRGYPDLHHLLWC